jgi:hypothetical protein
VRYRQGFEPATTSGSSTPAAQPLFSSPRYACPARTAPAVHFEAELPPTLLSRATSTSSIGASGARPDRRPTVPLSDSPPPLELQVGKPRRPESTASSMPSPHHHLTHIGQPPPSISPLLPLHRRLCRREPLPPPPLSHHGLPASTPRPTTITRAALQPRLARSASGPHAPPVAKAACHAKRTASP